MSPRHSKKTLKRTILARQCSAAPASPTTTIITITIPPITAATTRTLLFILLWHRFETKSCARKSIWAARQVLQSAGDNEDACDDVFCNTVQPIRRLVLQPVHCSTEDDIAGLEFARRAQAESFHHGCCVAFVVFLLLGDWSDWCSVFCNTTWCVAIWRGLGIDNLHRQFLIV